MLVVFRTGMQFALCCCIGTLGRDWTWASAYVFLCIVIGCILSDAVSIYILWDFVGVGFDGDPAHALHLEVKDLEVEV